MLEIEKKAKQHAQVFDVLKREVQSLNFTEIFKDAESLKKIYKIMTEHVKSKSSQGAAIIQDAAAEEGDEEMDDNELEIDSLLSK